MNNIEDICRQYLDGNLTTCTFQLKLISLIADFDYNNLTVLAKTITATED